MQLNRLVAYSVRQQPTFWRGGFGGISSALKYKYSGILDVFSSIAVPSRGASIFNNLPLFHENLLRYSCAGK
jgi:hypothetical protein